MSVAVLAGVMAFAIVPGRTYDLARDEMSFAGSSNNSFVTESSRCGASLTGGELETCERGGKPLSELDIWSMRMSSRQSETQSWQ